MNDFIMLTCNSCGGKLQITPEIDNFACMYCGTEYQVRREGGIVALTPLVEEIMKVSVSTDKTASELAIVRLKEELSSLQDDLDQKQENLHEWKLQKTDERTKLEKETKERRIPLVAAIFGASIIISSIICNGLIKLDTNTIIIIAIVLTVAIYIILSSRNPKDIFRRNWTEEIDRDIQDNEQKWIRNQTILEQLIFQKKKEIEKHKKIVEGDI